jgi:hypothetical protein
MSYIKQLFDDIDKTNDETIVELVKYRHAYDIFMEYWESMPEDKRIEANKRLEGLGL